MDQGHTRALEARKSGIERELRDLRRRFRIRTATGRLYLVTGILITFVTPFVYFSTLNPVMLLGILYGVLFMAFPLAAPPGEIETEIQRVEGELDLLTISDTSAEQRAEKLFKLHQFELKKYYDQTLKHSSWIFFVGIACIILGFILIAYAIYQVTIAPDRELSEKIVLGSLGAIGGLLADFIAVIYMKMYSETIKSLTEFHNRLVTTHHLHFGNFLASKIADKSLREKTVSEIAIAIAKH